MAKRQNYKYAIVNDKIVRVIVQLKLDSRCACVDNDGVQHIVSKYDVYNTLHEAKSALEETPEI